MAQPTAIVVTRNEEKRLAACLDHLRVFEDVRVVDSHSADGTADVAAAYGRPVILFSWDGRYPKKRQWCLRHLNRLRDWVLFIDADEEMTPALAAEIQARLQDPRGADGFFIAGVPVMAGRPLRAGRRHRKLSLFRHALFAYPDWEDTSDPGIACIGDIEGHYQPMPQARGVRTAYLRAPLWHHWADDDAAWLKRHAHYAIWEARMRAHGNAHRADPDGTHAVLKKIYDALPCQNALAWVDSFILQGGLMDGARGLRYANMRARYAGMVQQASVVADFVSKQGGGGQVA